MRRPVAVTLTGGPRDGEADELPADPGGPPRVLHTIGAGGWYEPTADGRVWAWMPNEVAEARYRRAGQ